MSKPVNNHEKTLADFIVTGRATITLEARMAGLMEQVAANLRIGTMKLHPQSKFVITNNLDGEVQSVAINLYVDTSS